MSYIKSCYVYINFKRTNQSWGSSKISQSINAEWRTCYRSPSESKKNFGRLIKQETLQSKNKIEIFKSSEKY